MMNPLHPRLPTLIALILSLALGVAAYLFLLEMPRVSVPLLVIASVGLLLMYLNQIRQSAHAAESDARYRLALESAGDGLLDWDLSTDLMYLSAHWKSALGFGETELESRKDWDALIDPAQREKVSAALEAHFENRTASYESEHRIRCKDHSYRWILERGRVIERDDAGRPMRLVGTHTDITEKQRARAARDRFFDLSLDMFCVAARDGHFKHINPAFERTLGYTREELVSIPFIDLVHPDDKHATSQAFADLLDGKEVRFFENRYRCKEGDYRWFQWSSASDPAEKLAYAVARDVTEKKVIDQMLHYYESIVAASPDLLSLVDRNYVYRAVNDAYLSAHGKTRDEIVGHHVADLFGEAVFEEKIRPWVDRCLAGEEIAYQSWFEFSGLGHRFAETDYYPVRDPEGHVQGVAVNVSDITERKKAEDALHHRLSLEKLVAGISARLAHTTASKLDTAVNQSLEELGVFVGVDRSYLFQVSADGLTMSNTHEWCAPGIEPQRKHLQNQRLTDFSWAIEKLSRQEALHVPRVADLPNEAAFLRSVLEAGAILSILNVPLHWGQRLRGIIGFDAVCHAKTWDEADITLLRTVGEVFAHALERRETEEELRRREASLAEAQRVAHLGSWELDLINNELKWSDEVYRIFESDPARFGGSYQDFLERVHPEDRQAVDGAYRDWARNKTPYDLVHRVLMEDGRLKYVHERCETYYDEAGQPVRTVGIVHDVTSRKQAEQKLRLSAAVFENTKEGVVITDAGGAIVAVNRAFTEITGYAEQEVLHRDLSLLKSGRHHEQFYAAIWASLKETEHWQGEIWNRRKNGEIYPQWLTVSTVRDEEGDITNYVGVFSDISQIKQSEERLEHLAHYDPLTDLPNRLLLHSRLEHAVDRAHRQACKVAVLFLDLDRFKNINDGLGHPAGDELLQSIVQRLSQRLREDDTLARWGGDEFIILIEAVENAQAAATLAHDVLNELAAPFRLSSGHEVYIGGSIGISLYPEDGKDTTQLIKNADAAMYRAKERGRNTYRFYTTALSVAASERLAMETRLRRAMEQKEFVVHYQPVVAVTNGEIVGAEALVRWQTGGEGVVTPRRFIRTAEESGVIAPLGEWVLRTACSQAQRWLAQGLPRFRLAVNLSSRQIRGKGLAENIHKILEQTAFSPRRLELEITESAIIEEGGQVLGSLQALKGQGITLAIDDFGTGYSSLAYLKRFPIDKLKIDKSFVRDIPDDPNDVEIATAIIAMARNLKLKVLAEGVETQAQLDFLREQGCDQYQGYFYSRPLPGDEFGRLLERQMSETGVM